MKAIEQLAEHTIVVPYETYIAFTGSTVQQINITDSLIKQCSFSNVAKVKLDLHIQLLDK